MSPTADLYCNGRSGGSCRPLSFAISYRKVRIAFGVDPFFYFQRLARQDGAPALIYDWTVTKIEMQTAPRRETKPKYLERDPRLLGWREIEKTDAWQDDNGSAEYLLYCRRSEAPPRRELRR